MEPVIAWAIGVGSVIFGLGLISALASRKQRHGHREKAMRPKNLGDISLENSIYRSGGMKMAASGTPNESRTPEGDLASIGGNSR